ncbi:MAG: hypothetical protein A2682_02275 [Candidatus Terrybacteria bacterium RIFCSPHIGHO2_01_FULL_58_15]|uniref:Uncharacterized protein n=1 Tax=Terrybacteria sp. (strain RIFCSPHIGHO2_01_FULL_58_15) TaxID=1802363 RepID=A0A1G2PP18_TERXR|nr:MAG: hypothetical protein A2682_02275 [Candidatus Terrybacteria bacterium RIFCSPHIGHO2_01_FULL_58_15]
MPMEHVTTLIAFVIVYFGPAIYATRKGMNDAAMLWLALGWLAAIGAAILLEPSMLCGSRLHCQ